MASNAFHYKGYVGSIEPDIEERMLFGRVLGIPDMLMYEGETVEALEKDFQETVDEYLASCERRGKTPAKSFSGKIMIRVPSEVHKRVALEAKRKGKSINAVISELLDDSFPSDSTPLQA